MCDLVAFMNRAFAQDADMNVGKSHETALPNAAFLHAGDARDLADRLRICVTNSGAACASKTSPMDSFQHSETVKNDDRTRKERAAQSSARAQAGPPIKADEMPTAAARDVSASERWCKASASRALLCRAALRRRTNRKSDSLENDGRPKNDTR